MQIQSTSIIRNRGQLTIPDLIRGRTSWVTPGSVVTVIQTKADEIVIKPYSTLKLMNWELLWKKIKKVRAFKGTGQPVGLSEFIVSDRESH